MAYWTWEERVDALTPPYQLKRSFKTQQAWEKQQRAELGFPEEPYQEGLQFHHRKVKKGVEWAVEDAAKHRAWVVEDSKVERPERGTREWLVWGVEHYNVGLLAEGLNDTVEEAWAAACAAVGTDRLELGRASWLTWRRKEIAKLKEFDRISALRPEEVTARPQRFVYTEVPYDIEDYWGLSEEYRRQRQRFCFRRHRIVKETKVFLFIDLENYDTIDCNGEMEPEDKRFKWHREDVNLARVRRDLWDSPQLNWNGEPEKTASRYVRWGGRTTGDWIWLDLETMVAELDARRAGFVSSMASADSPAAGWVQTLGLDGYGREMSGMSHRELQRYYRRAVMKAHPDKGGSAEQFQRVQDAYEHAKRVLATCH
jgi:hypothetical protein